MSEFKIDGIKKFELGEKHFSTPYSIEGNCPKCNVEMWQDVHLFYVWFNKVQEQQMRCGECKHIWNVNIKIVFDIVIVPDSPVKEP